MPRMGFERMAPVFELVKTVHALDSMATVASCLAVWVVLIHKKLNSMV
jgi:hypothetical protein